MIVYNEELGDKDCELNTDKNTKKFLIAFFGFYNHNISEDFENFLIELDIKKNLKEEGKLIKFKLDSNYALEAYNICDRRTFDVTMILPKVFENKQEALNWFNSKVKQSDYIKKSEISEVDVLDGDKLISYLNKEIAYDTKVKNFEKVFNEKIKELKQKMLEEFSQDEDYKEIIKNKFSSYF